MGKTDAAQRVGDILTEDNLYRRTEKTYLIYQVAARQAALPPDLQREQKVLCALQSAEHVLQQEAPQVLLPVEALFPIRGKQILQFLLLEERTPEKSHRKESRFHERSGEAEAVLLAHASEAQVSGVR
jgi:hypothetical protein